MSACPDCPECGHPPMPPTENICSNADCRVFSWNPDQTPAELRARTPDEIDLGFLDHPE